jgi:hypothetical protein
MHPCIDSSSAIESKYLRESREVNGFNAGRGRTVHSNRNGEGMERLHAIKVVTVKNLFHGAMPALLYIGLFVVIFMTVGCTRKVAKQEASHVAPATPPAEVQHSVLTATTMIPSSDLCRGLKGDSETKCLCPNPLQFGLSSLPESLDHNLSTDIDIKKSVRPMYRIRIFSDDDFENVGGVVAIPNNGNSLNLTGRMDADPASVILSSSSPKDEFILKVETEKALRVKCINQED